MRACSMPGRRTSVAHFSFALTLDVMTLFVKDLPMTVYSLTGFMGGVPVTVNPIGLVRSASDGDGELQLAGP